MVTTAYKRIAKLYGDSPFHLLAFVASFALVGYAGQILFAHMTIRVAVWFGGAAVVHDLLLLPLYGLVNAAITWVWRRAPRVGSVSWLNYVRFPAAISALLFLIYVPEITRQRTAQLRDSGVSNHQYLAHWLLTSAVLFALSASVLLVRLAQAGRAGNSVAP
jgi:hypothetical protein